MKTTLRISKSAAKTGIIGGIFMSLFGIGFGIFVNIDMIQEAIDEGFIKSGLLFIDLFFLGWIGLTIYMIIYYLRAYKGQNDANVLEIDSLDSGFTYSNSANELVDNIKERLETLEKLKDNGTITESEYNQQRSEILKSI